MIDYYRILGIEFGVDLEEIRKAYKKKALEFHPDKNNGEKNYEERFIEIQNAYNVLKDSSTKEEYDKQYQSSIEHLIFNVKNYKLLPEEKLPDYIKGFYELEIRQHNKKLSELYCNHKIVDNIFYKSWALSQFYLFHTHSPKFEKWEEEIKYFRDAIGKDILEILKNPNLLIPSKNQEDFINLYLQELAEKDINRRTKEQIEFSMFFLSQEKRKQAAEILVFEYLNIVSRYSSFLESAKQSSEVNKNNTILSKVIQEIKPLVDSRGVNNFQSGGIWTLILGAMPIKDKDEEIIFDSLCRDKTNDKIENIKNIIDISRKIITLNDYSDLNLRAFSYIIKQLHKYVKNDIKAKETLKELDGLYLSFINEYYKSTLKNEITEFEALMRITHFKDDIFFETKDIQTELKKILDYENKKTSDKRCFIATACYEDYNSKEVIILREFRDEKLKMSAFGRFFIKTYYIISPPIATFISKYDVLKVIIRKYFLDTVIRVITKE